MSFLNELHRFVQFLVICEWIAKMIYENAFACICRDSFSVVNMNFVNMLFLLSNLSRFQDLAGNAYCGFCALWATVAGMLSSSAFISKQSSLRTFKERKGKKQSRSGKSFRPGASGTTGKTGKTGKPGKSGKSNWKNGKSGRKIGRLNLRPCRFLYFNAKTWRPWNNSVHLFNQ